MADVTNIIGDGRSGSYPCGTRDEIKEMQLDPAAVGTCSQPVPGVNAGCPFFNHKKFRCVFSYARNAEAGPVNIGYFKRLGRMEDRNKIEQGYEMPCYLFMEGEFELWNQRHLSGGTVGYSRFLREGEQIIRRIKVPRHTKPNPECAKCKNGTCNLFDTKEIPITIEPFPRPTESIRQSIFPDDVDEEVGTSLEHRAMKQPKSGAQVEAIMAETKRARELKERPDGST